MKKFDLKNSCRAAASAPCAAACYATALAVVVLAVVILVNLVVQRTAHQVHRVRYFHYVAVSR